MSLRQVRTDASCLWKRYFQLNQPGEFTPCTTGTLNNGASSTLAFLGHRPDTPLPSLLPTQFAQFSWLPEATSGSRLGGFVAMWWSQTAPSKPNAPRHQGITS